MNLRIGSDAIPADVALRDLAGDAILSLRNRARYLQQSAETVAGQRAEVPTLGQVDAEFAARFGGGHV